MRDLPQALIDAQKWAPFVFPKVRIRIRNQRGNARLLLWDRLYQGGSPAQQHDSTMPADGSLVRIRRYTAGGIIFRSRVADPGPGSDFGQWTSTGFPGLDVCCCSHGSEVLIFIIPAGSPYHVYRLESSDYGATFGSPIDCGWVSDANGAIGAAQKDNGDVCVMYTRAGQLYARKRVSDSWGSESASALTYNGTSGVSLVHYGDWNYALTGEDTSSRDGVWAGIFGDGWNYDVGTWGGNMPILRRDSTEAFEYHCPSVDYIDTFRVVFTEEHTDPTAGFRSFWTHLPAGCDYVADAWHEPVAFDYTTQYGPAITHFGDYAWLTTPDGVWRADYTEWVWDITNQVLEVEQVILPKSFRNRLVVILDNTAGMFNSFNKLGFEITLELGYQTGQGPLYSPTQSFYITGWKFVSPPWFPLRAIYPYGVVGTLRIEAEDAWGLLKRWRPARTIEWAEGEYSIYGMTRYLLGRIGFDFSAFSYSQAFTDTLPAFTITPGTSGLTALRKLMSYVQDVLIQREDTIYALDPRADDESVYTYHHLIGTAHLVYRGSYGQGAWDPNRVQVSGDTFMAEELEIGQIEQVYERVKRTTSPDYPSVTQAGWRATAELRKGQMFFENDGWAQVPTNCGQEPWDVITITDGNAGVSGITRRVIGIKTHYLRDKYLFQQVLKLSAV